MKQVLSVRIDKWLWAARFFKTRGLAQAEIEKGRVTVDKDSVKVSRLLRVGDIVRLEQGDWEREVTVLILSDVRGSAPVAQTLYQDSVASLEAKEKSRQRRALFTEPASQIKGRPSKKDRRSLDRANVSD